MAHGSPTQNLLQSDEQAAIVSTNLSSQEFLLVVLSKQSSAQEIVDVMKIEAEATENWRKKHA
jgi:hypothetical protein